LFYITGPNIAVGQHASQSPGQYGKHAAIYAVDGKLDNNVNSGDLCAHTNFSDTVARWTVTLNQTYNITGIIIYNRKHICKFDTIYNIST